MALPASAWLLLYLAGSIVAYEALRSLVVGALRRTQERRVDRFLRDHRIPTDPFRHTHRVVVKEMVLSDPGLVEAMASRARKTGAPVAAVQAQVRRWLDEMVPQFNLLAYYAVGYRVARTVGYSLYDVRLDRASWASAMAKVPPGAAVVLASNHRSNMDFVVTGFMVSKSVQVSYAVGEWARVWPLDRLFRSFGSYFVRRGEKDPLYHRTLEAYVQLVTKQGVTQAVFPEGGLSRDGALRPCKMGLLDHMARSKLDPSFTRPLCIVPVGINFDRVLEDEVLVRETVDGDHPLRRRTLGQKARRLASLAGRILVGGPINVARILLRRPKRHGTCAIRFGEPLVLDDWLAAHSGSDALAKPDRHERWRHLEPLGDELMRRIARTVPPTPVPIVAQACRELGGQALAGGVERSQMVQATRAVLARLRADGRIGAGPARGEAEGADGLADIDEAVRAADEADRAVAAALDVAAPRILLFDRRAGTVRCPPARWPLVEYYARSLDPPAGHPSAVPGRATPIAPAVPQTTGHPPATPPAR